MNLKILRRWREEIQVDLRKIDRLLTEMQYWQNQDCETQAERTRYHTQFRKDMDELWAKLKRIQADQAILK